MNATLAPETPNAKLVEGSDGLLLEVDGIKQPTKAQITEASKDGKLLLRLRRGSASFYVALKKP